MEEKLSIASQRKSFMQTLTLQKLLCLTSTDFKWQVSIAQDSFKFAVVRTWCLKSSQFFL